MSSTDDIHLIAESARRLGMTIDEAGMTAWLAAMDDEGTGGQVVVDLESGHLRPSGEHARLQPEELARFRIIGEIVKLPDVDGVAEEALALSGSAAQSRSSPSVTPTSSSASTSRRQPAEEACRIMADIMRDKVLSTTRGDAPQFLEAKLGSFPFDCKSHGWDNHKGGPISWNLDEIRAGELVTELPDGSTKTLKWHEVALDPGWCKLDWVVSDPIRRTALEHLRQLRASSTWRGRSPDGGKIVPLDGHLDTYFPRRSYLDA